MLRRTLEGTDLELPAVGFGAAPLGDEYGALEQQEAVSVVRTALDFGIDYFDTSPYYGRTLSESRLGRALAGVRDRAVISTKAGRYDRDYPGGFDFSRGRITASIEESLKHLRTDYVDIVFLHDIEFGSLSMILDDALPALMDARDAGKARYVGVSGYPLEILVEVVETGAVDAVLSYCHGDLLDDSVVEVLVPAARAHGFGVVSASPLHMGLLSPTGPPQWHPAGPERRQAARALIDHCEDMGVPVAAAAISYAVDLAGPASVLTGISSEAELTACVAAARDPVDRGLLDDLVALRNRFDGRPWSSGIR